ncbi:DUF2971 domain-containing protein [Streptomyces sp. NPDC002143]
MSAMDLTGVNQFPPDWLTEINKIPTRQQLAQMNSYADESIALDAVYHYTNAAGLLGIISGGQLWATDVEFLNDAQELTYAGDRLLRVIQAELVTASLREHVTAGNTGDPQMVEESRAREYRRKNWDRHKNLGNGLGLLPALNSIVDELGQMRGPSRSSPLHVYVTCFCLTGDLLSQWRGYGGVGGYSICFRSDILKSVADRFRRGDFLGIVYGFDEAVKYHRDHFFPEHLYSGTTLMDDYLKALTTIKNPAFSEEREWRLMIPREEIRDDVGFRVGPVGVTPYLEVTFPRDAVTEVIVGPGQHPKERANGIRQLLDRYGMNWVQVKLSTTSLRL